LKHIAGRIKAIKVPINAPFNPRIVSTFSIKIAMIIVAQTIPSVKLRNTLKMFKIIQEYSRLVVTKGMNKSLMEEYKSSQSLVMTGNE